MIYLISQIIFLFLTQIYYNMNFITSSSMLSHDFPGTLRLIFADCFWRNFSVVHKRRIFVNISAKTCLKELGNLLKCKETFEKFIAAWTLLKILVFHIFFQKFSTNVFKEHQFPNKNQKLLLYWALWIQN